MHVMDVAAPGAGLDEKGFADLGHGVMDWQRLWDASVDAGAQLMVVEHDLPSDWRRFARRSIVTTRRLGAGIVVIREMSLLTTCCFYLCLPLYRGFR